MTSRQAEILAFIRAYREAHHRAPAAHDIAEYFGISKNGAYCILQRLAHRGVITVDFYVSRSIRVVGETPVYVPDRHVGAVRALLRKLESREGSARARSESNARATADVP